MDTGVAPATQRNQVLLRIITGLAAKFLVMNLQIGHRAAGLASPSIATEYLVAELFVWLGIEPQARLLRSEEIHEAFSPK
jgi:hypothetical protein